jgi:acyl-CoA thioester hydrolase
MKDEPKLWHPEPPLVQNDINGTFEGKTHLQPVRVYYEDTDLSGIVFYGNYAKFIERGRTNFLRLVGVHHQDLLDLPEPVAFTVTRLEIDYLKPARIDNTLQVRSTYTKMTAARIYGTQIVWRGDEELVRAKIEAACINLDGKARRIPKYVREALASYLSPEAL